ncbi:hypothetical protein C5167_027251 [Papaver somniferum]|nr:hypothetical protein C5167_027251 [Papaver somniferum]
MVVVADMHCADGISTPCEDVLPDQFKGCSDLDTTHFLNRMIKAENPDFIVFTGDNIFGFDATDAVKSLNAAFAPTIESGIPWAAVLGNHDQESTFLEVVGVDGSSLQNKSILNLYFLDSGDYSTVPSIHGYGWIKTSQQFWFKQSSLELQRAYMNKPEAQKAPAPGLAYFHIPLPEYASLDSSNFTDVKQEGISSASINSGFFTTMVESGDVKAVFEGKSSISDVRENRKRRLGDVKSIRTWNRLDDEHLTSINAQLVKLVQEVPEITHFLSAHCNMKQHIPFYYFSLFLGMQENGGAC